MTTLLCLALSLGCLPVAGQASPILTVQDASWAPYSFGGEGNLKGFAKEILERCLPAGGLGFEFARFPIVRMFNYLESGELDLHVVSHTVEREEFLHYGAEPLFESSYRPIVRNSNPLRVESLEDLDDQRLGSIRGIEYIDWFQDYVDARDAEGSVEWAPDNETVLRMLLANRIDVVVTTVATSLWLAESLGRRNEIRVVDFDIKTSPYFLVLSKASPRVEAPEEYLERVDACIREFKSGPEYPALVERYLLRPDVSAL